MAEPHVTSPLSVIDLGIIHRGALGFCKQKGGIGTTQPSSRLLFHRIY